MKIVTFDPMIVSPQADDIMAVFEELGFEKSRDVEAPTTTVATTPLA